MNDDKTVAVPIELIEKYLASSDSERWPQMADALHALLPKPEPRLVTVDLNDLPGEPASGVWKYRGHFSFSAWIHNKPDLLPIIDDVIDEVGGLMYGIEPEAVTVMKARMRTALVVTE